jgi:hypothetical protein
MRLTVNEFYMFLTDEAEDLRYTFRFLASDIYVKYERKRCVDEPMGCKMNFFTILVGLMKFTSSALGFFTFL